jgi:PAS domain S-box-containing protein
MAAGWRAMNLLPPILLVDTNAADRDLASLVLNGAFGEVSVEPIGDASALTRALAARRFGLVITELELGWIGGTEVVRLVRELEPDCAVILFTRLLSAELVDEAIRLGVDAYVSKDSAGYTRLPFAVRSALYRARRRAMENAREAPYRRVFEDLPVGIFVATSDGEILEANSALARILAFESPEELTRRSLRHFFVQEGAAERWRTTLEKAGSIEGFEAELRKADGEPVRVRLRTSFVEGEIARTRQLLGMAEVVPPAAADREASPRTPVPGSRDELEQMAYVVSHDLQQPLNVVGRFLDLLADRESGQLSATGREYLEHAMNGAANLQRMMDAMLRYARVNTADQRFELIDLNRVRDRVIETLDKEISDLDAEISSDELPLVLADETQMEQLFQNLLSNSLKFHGAEPPKIHIGLDEKPEAWTLSFRDNGIGIAPKDSDRIFQMFQRLHTQEEFPGTGIGLAVCKKIVDRHGGRIWVESSPGRGAAFLVALPKRAGGGAGGDW